MVSAQTRSPTATVPVEPRPRATRSNIPQAVVRLVDDDELALWLLAQVEGGEHAREDEDGVALRA